MAETFLLYEYNSEGYHNGHITISEDTLPMVFKTIVRVAREDKREVIITDLGDLCVFHMKDGEVLFPKPE
jgi:hypothetical protein